MRAMQLSLWQADARDDQRATYAAGKPPSYAPGKAPRGAGKNDNARTGDNALRATETLSERADWFEANAHAKRTRASYQSDWDAFDAWCRAQGRIAMPAS